MHNPLTYFGNATINLYGEICWRHPKSCVLKRCKELLVSTEYRNLDGVRTDNKCSILDDIRHIPGRILGHFLYGNKITVFILCELPLLAHYFISLLSYPLLLLLRHFLCNHVLLHNNR